MKLNELKSHVGIIIVRTVKVIVALDCADCHKMEGTKIARLWRDLSIVIRSTNPRENY